MSKHENYDRYFEPATAFTAEGARCGITNCKVCGAAILLDPRSETDFAKLHGEWHDLQDAVKPLGSE